ncbi:hypothetical protein GCM10023147_18500 [Tsukamurella soli]|uniref:Uncharacterized protein n=1 Tax=Tsukamurella soli TaxID=644556 RepID=A0ABP8JGI3_9ACTN
MSNESSITEDLIRITSNRFDVAGGLARGEGSATCQTRPVDRRMGPHGRCGYDSSGEARAGGADMVETVTAFEADRAEVRDGAAARAATVHAAVAGRPGAQGRPGVAEVGS